MDELVAILAKRAGLDAMDVLQVFLSDALVGCRLEVCHPRYLRGLSSSVLHGVRIDQCVFRKKGDS